MKRRSPPLSVTAKAVGSAIWHVGAGLGGRIVGALGTLMLTHYLNPEVVGEVGVAWVLVLTSQTAFSAGFGQYVVAHPQAGSSTGFHVTVLSATTVAFVSVLLLLFGPPLCHWVNAPGAIAFLPGLVAALAILRIAEIPERVLNRELRFRRVALGGSGAEVVFASTALGLAAMGWGGHAIVMANVVRSIFRLVIFSTGVDPATWLCRGPLDRKQTLAILGFAFPLQLAALAATAAAKGSGLAISVMFGPAAMGLYTLAFNLAQIPADNIGESLADVLLPSFARLEPGKRQKALARSMPLVALLVFPLAVGLGVEAHPLVSTFFNPRWQPMAPLLTVLAVLGVVYPMGAALQAFLKASGRPKGVAMVQGALLNLLSWQVENSTSGLGDKTLQLAPLSFDVSFQEIFSTWLSGGTLVLTDEESRTDPARLLEHLVSSGVRRLFLPYVALNQMAEVAIRRGPLPVGLREVVTAGEALRITRPIAELFRQLPRCQLQNQYGPSETHVVTAYTLTGPSAEWPVLPPIGRALPNVHLAILDESGKPVEPGQEGELYVGGVALARGYVGQPELTQQRFVSDPQTGARLYRTGDQVKERPDGEMEFLGRGDDQIKLRGYRVELGEIEVALSQHPDIAQAAVALREDEPGHRRLVAYLVGADGRVPRATEIRRHLQARLPEYMVPASFVVLPTLPRTPSGKVDRRGLPRPGHDRPALDVGFEAPRGREEEAIAQIWARLLDIERVGALDSFFDLGGTSLLAVQSVLALREALGRDVPVVKLFQYASVRALAGYLAGDKKAQGPRPQAPRLPSRERVGRWPSSAWRDDFPARAVWTSCGATCAPGAKPSASSRRRNWIRGSMGRSPDTWRPGAFSRMRTSVSAEQRTRVQRRRHVVVRRTHPILRRAGYGHGVQRWRGRGGVQTPRRRLGRRGSHLCGHPRRGREQRRGRQGQLHRAQRRGARRFVVAGMCSGASNAHRVAAADARVAGLIMFDGYAYPMHQFYLRRYGPRLVHPASAISFVSRQLANLLGNRPRSQPASDDDEILSQDFPPQERIASELRQMMERNVSLLMAFTGSWYLYFNYRQQIRDNFPDVPFGDRLTVEHFPEADHTYTLLQDRERLFATVLTWMQSRF